MVFVVASHYLSLRIIVLLLQTCLLGSEGLSRTLLLQQLHRLQQDRRFTGSPHIRFRTNYLYRACCVSANFYYARGTRGLLVRGLEPKLRNRSEPARRSNIVTRDET